ncbi:hypothetical protein KI387_033789, partial [Taxus chinensis]
MAEEFTKVVDAKAVLQKGPQGHQMRLAECLVGDDTAIIVFIARGDQVELVKPGATIILHNAKVDMFRGCIPYKLMDQFNIIKEIKEVGTIKIFLPSEFRNVTLSGDLLKFQLVLHGWRLPCELLVLSLLDVFFINCLQICPKIRSLQWESVVTFLSPSLKSFSHRVESGRIVEITIAQLWSSGNGSLATTLVDLE